MDFDGVLQNMVAWCEQCPCHEHLQQKYMGEHIPAEVCREELGQNTGGLTCVNRGCRAPDVAAGELFKKLDEAFTGGLGRLSLSWRSRLSQDQWALLIADWARAKSHAVYIISKAQHWQHLPWLLCVLGHFDESVARQGAKDILAQVTRCPGADVNHRLTLQACAPDSRLGKQLRAFAGGVRLDSLDELMALAATLARAPITERCIEQPHGAVKLNTAFKHAGPLAVTASIRAPEIDPDFRSQDEWEALSNFVEQAKHARRIPHALGIQGHPWLRALPATGAQTHKVVSLLTSIICRCDAGSQYVAFESTRKAHAAASRKRKTHAEQKLAPAKAVLGHGTFMANLATEHFRTVADKARVYSLPSQLRGSYVAPLRKHMHPRAGGGRDAGYADMSLDVADDDANVIDSDVCEELALPAGSVGRQRRVHFRLVHAGPSRQRKLAAPTAGSSQLGAHHLTVAIVECGMDDHGSVRFDAGGAVGTTLQDRVAVLSYLHSDAQWLRANLLEHTDATELTCSLEGIPVEASQTAALQRLLDGMLSSLALPGSSCRYLPKPGDEPLLQILADEGAAQAAMAPDGVQSWALTSGGLQRIRYESGLSDGETIMHPRAECHVGVNICCAV